MCSGMGFLFPFWNHIDVCNCCCKLFLAPYDIIFWSMGTRYSPCYLFMLWNFIKSTNVVYFLTFVPPFYGVIGLFLIIWTPIVFDGSLLAFLPQILGFHLESHFSNSKLNGFCAFKSWLLNLVKVITFNAPTFKLLICSLLQIFTLKLIITCRSK
jgi:hypothetical protein